MPLLSCPNCGGPLPRHARWTAVSCSYCGASVTPGPATVSRKSYQRAWTDAESELSRSPTDVTVAGTRWRQLTFLGHGELSDVFLVTRARRLTERAVLKLLRDPADSDLFAREWDTLSALHTSDARGAPHFSRLVPAPVVRGAAGGLGDPSRAASVQSLPPGFAANLDDVRAAFPSGVDPRHAIWMWRRLLELLGWVHRSGWVHGAVLPQHVLLDAAGHGATLVGWSCAARVGDPLPALCATREAFYPAAERSGHPAGPTTDLVMAARCVAFVAGSDAAAAGAADALPTDLADSLREVLSASLSGATPDDAWLLNGAVAAAAERAFGPPSFVPFAIPPRAGA
jgi:hypothetical protein